MYVSARVATESRVASETGMELEPSSSADAATPREATIAANATNAIDGHGERRDARRGRIAAGGACARPILLQSDACPRSTRTSTARARDAP